jgi:hypothetical protein
MHEAVTVYIALYIAQECKVLPVAHAPDRRTQLSNPGGRASDWSSHPEVSKFLVQSWWYRLASLYELNLRDTIS